MESAVHAAVPLRVGKKMRKRRELDALVSGGGARSGRLLSASSDEGEPWGRRSARRRRSRPFIRLAAALALCVCVVSAATVLWLFVDVRRQIVSLRMEMDRVSATSDIVGDELQICHTAAKELRTNASHYSIRLKKLESDHQELSKRVEQAIVELAAVSDQLSAAPKLADTPRRLAELQRTVADFGSQINGFDGALNSARKQAVAAASGVEEVKTRLHELEAKTNETIANVSNNVKRDEELKQQVITLNTTLGAQVDNLRNRIEDISKAASTPAPIAPVAPPVVPASGTSSTPSNTTATSTTTTTTTQPPPDQRIKPSVLQ